VYVKEQMGHSSIQVTVDLYGHLIRGGNIQAVDRLDGPVEKAPEIGQSATQPQPHQFVPIKKPYRDGQQG
jgi:integrase